MAEPPSGTATFLFTDIEGSTKLWERDEAAMRLALARHDEILGRVDKFEPVAEGCEEDHAEEAVGELVVSGRHRSIYLQMAEHTLDAILLTV